MKRAPRRGLVIGAGAALGGAWALGALTALADVEGYDPRAADLLIGTSAGSVLAALIASGVPTDDMVRRLSGAGPELDGTAPVNPLDLEPDRVRSALAAMPRPTLLPANLALAARAVTNPRNHTLMTLAAALSPRGRGDLGPVRELVDTATHGRWPARQLLWVVAMHASSGRRVVFSRSDAPRVPLADAVVASCSAPGYFPPVSVGGALYVDGGAVSMTNADIAASADLDEVLVLAPMCMRERDRASSLLARMERRLRWYANRRLDIEVRRLVDPGVAVRVFAPGAADLDAIGDNIMNPDRRDQVFATAVESTRALLAHVPRATGERGGLSA